MARHKGVEVKTNHELPFTVFCLPQSTHHNSRIRLFVAVDGDTISNIMSENTDSFAALAALPQLGARYRGGEFDPAEYAARYIVQWQWARHGTRYVQRRSRLDRKPDGAAWFAQLDTLPPGERAGLLIDFLERYDLREVSRRVNLALIGWLRGRWPLTLCEKVLGVRDVLHMQARGSRPVTVIADYPRLLEPVLDKPDAFAFVCHDLMHAWQFFHDSKRHEAQCRLAQRLEEAIGHGVFTPYLNDPVFIEKFDYLCADMNTHPRHSLQYLRAILLDFHLRAEGKDPSEQISSKSRARLEECFSGFSALGASFF